MAYKIKYFIRFSLIGLGIILLIQKPIYSLPHENSPLFLAKELIKAIKKDDANISYTAMIDGMVMREHTLSHHEKSQSYFYTDNPYIISEIVSMVVENPDGAINEINQTGVLKIYRKFNFDRDIKPLFIKEKKYQQDNQDSFLGETHQGPTNQVLVLLEVKDYQNYKMNGEKISYKDQNVQFLNAYPIRSEVK